MNKETERPSKSSLSPFERIKRINDSGMEFWSSRDFAEVLDYGDYRNFEGVIDKKSCKAFGPTEATSKRLHRTPGVARQLVICYGAPRWDAPMNPPVTPEQNVVALCRAKKLKLATAESCSGGLIAHRVTNVTGASEVFLGGMVAYSNAVKVQCLGVRVETLAAHGAVSEEVARAMADGARRVFGADLAVGVTGIAGPGGGTPEKPVGLIYIAVSSPNGTHAARCQFEGGREEIKADTAATALEMILEVLDA